MENKLNYNNSGGGTFGNFIVLGKNEILNSNQDSKYSGSDLIKEVEKNIRNRKNSESNQTLGNFNKMRDEKLTHFIRNIKLTG